MFTAPVYESRLLGIVGVSLLTAGLTLLLSGGASAAVRSSCADSADSMVGAACGSNLNAGDLKADWAGRINAMVPA